MGDSRVYGDDNQHMSIPTIIQFNCQDRMM